VGDFDFGKPEKEPDCTDLSHPARKDLWPLVGESELSALALFT